MLVICSVHCLSYCCIYVFILMGLWLNGFLKKIKITVIIFNKNLNLENLKKYPLIQSACLKTPYLTRVPIVYCSSLNITPNYRVYSLIDVACHD